MSDGGHIDVARAKELLLDMADRSPDFPSGHLMIHPDELIAVVEVLTKPTKVGCGCFLVDDDEGNSHVISNICPVHSPERPVDFYGDGFWAGYRGGPGIDPETLDDEDRAEWDAGYGAGAGAANPTTVAEARTLRER